jgi:Protein of unknown function (DUF3108)
MAQRLIFGFVLAVLAAHLLLLQTLGTLWQEPSRLQALATPMFTRELRSTPPSSAPSVGIRDFVKKRAIPPDNIETTAIHTIAKPEPQTDASASVTHDVAPDNATPPVLDPAKPADGTEADTVADWPADTKLSYALSGYYRGPITGRASVQWQRQGAQYQTQVALDLSGFNIYTMTSQGQATPQGLLPAAYEEKRVGAKVLQLGLEPQQIRLNDGQRVDRPAGVQDTASQFVELAYRFANGQAVMAVGSNVKLWLARPNAVAEWTYDIVGQETLHSATFGAMETFHLKPRPLANPSGTISAEIWFAPALQYLPVRIKITLSTDTWVDLMVEKIEQTDSAGAGLPPPASPR